MRKKKQLQYVAVALSAALVCGPVIPADAAGIQRGIQKGMYRCI